MSKYAITFPNTKVNYRYNKSTGLLEEDGTVDLVAEIQSNVQPTIEELFDKLMYTREEKEQLKYEEQRRESQDVLDTVLRYEDDLKQIKEKYNLKSDNVTDLIKEVQQIYNDNDKKINEMKSNVKEVRADETQKIDPQG